MASMRAMLRYSPLLKRPCARQVVLDKRFPLIAREARDRGAPPAAAAERGEELLARCRRRGGLVAMTTMMS